MALYVKVGEKQAEKAKRKLVANNALDMSFPVKHQSGFVLFPVSRKIEGFDLIEVKEKPLKKKPSSLKEALSKLLSDEEMEDLVTSFDTIGTIAVIEIPHSLETKASEIGEAVLSVHPNIKTVCMKAGKHDTQFRIMPVKVIAGEETLESDYIEHGVKMRVHLNEVYFSPRLSFERERIASLVKQGEEIAGLFAGVGPFPLVIAKKKKCVVHAVELNPRAYELMVENIQANKLKGEVHAILGDVREVTQSLPKCDRVLMPLPKGGEAFLVPAMICAKKGATIHFYTFSSNDDLFALPIAAIEKAARELGRKAEVINRKVVRPHSPKESQVVIDFTVF